MKLLKTLICRYCHQTFRTERRNKFCPDCRVVRLKESRSKSRKKTYQKNLDKNRQKGVERYHKLNPEAKYYNNFEEKFYAR